MARSVSETPSGRALRRAATWCETHDHGRAGGAGDHSDAGIHSARRDALEYARDGQSRRPESYRAISRIWHTFGLQPHRSETFKLSNDPLLVEKVRDIVGLYLDPPSHAAVFCVDENPQIQALDRTQPLLPLQPGQVERRTHDYKRHCTTTLFAALNAQTSEVITQFHQRHRSAQFREFLDLIDARVPKRLDVHIIRDNYSPHQTALIRNWFAKRPRFHVHFTPTYGSWLSLVERWFAELTMKQIRRRTFRSVPQRKAAIQAFIDVHQADPRPFVWTKSADEILATIARFAQRTVDARALQSMSNHGYRTLGRPAHRMDTG